MPERPLVDHRVSRRGVQPCAVPADSDIARLLPGAHFHDAWQVAVQHPERTALEQLLATLAATPHWVNLAMRLRNRVVVWFGLKDLGDLGLDQRQGTTARHRKPGDRVGIFTLRSCTDDEVLVEDDDRHLRVVLSVRRLRADATDPARVVLTTVVHLHNRLGWWYMLPVAPMHRLIAPAMLRRLGTPHASTVTD